MSHMGGRWPHVQQGGPGVATCAGPAVWRARGFTVDVALAAGVCRRSKGTS